MYDSILIREENNYQEKVRCSKVGDHYELLYIDCDQSNWLDKTVVMSMEDAEKIVRNCIGYFPNMREKKLEIIVSSDDFAKVLQFFEVWRKK